jgi:hypothetical protein
MTPLDAYCPYPTLDRNSLLPFVPHRFSTARTRWRLHQLRRILIFHRHFQHPLTQHWS